MKVLVYIRDQIYRRNFEYKFHITNCRTLIEAQQSRRYGRYVVSIKTDGMFSINIRRGSWTEEDKEQKLHVCKNCLGALNYKGYRGASERAKGEIYRGFSIEEYLQSKEEQTIIRPNHTNIDAPLDEYTEDWRDIAENFKRKQSYTCAKCGINLSEDKNFLHVHHIDGLKYNNWDDNLKALCIACHSTEPGHSHMQKRGEFREFQRKYGNRHQRILLFQG